MTRKDMAKELIATVERFRIANHTTIDNAVEEAVEQLLRLKTAKAHPCHRHKLHSKSEVLESMRIKRSKWFGLGGVLSPSAERYE